MRTPRLFLFVGYPGAGKTTIAQIIEQATGAVHIWADKERHEMFGKPEHTQAENQKLYNHLNQLTAQLLRDGKDVIFDTNFNFRKDRDHLCQIANAADAQATIIWVTTSVDLARHRAVEASNDRETRLYGNMSSADFERIAGHLEPPSESEKVIKVDGTNIDRQQLISLLKL